jgi:hypothetical protein
MFQELIISKENAENNSNIVNVYEVKNIDKLNIKIFESYNDEYFEFIANCKQDKIHLYDVIITPIIGLTSISWTQKIELFF